jgi:hypothetical protein
MSGYFSKELIASAQVDASDESGVVDVSGGSGAEATRRITIDCTAKEGTNPTLDVTVWVDIGGVEYLVETFTQLVDVGHETKSIANCPPHVNLKYAIGGTDTPKFTFSMGVWGQGAA